MAIKFKSKAQQVILFFLLFVSIAGCMSTQGNQDGGHLKPDQFKIYLLGEVHDNEIGHTKRLQDIKALTSNFKGEIAIIFEQINRPDLPGDHKNPWLSCQESDCLNLLMTESQWDPKPYQSVINLAIANQWKIYSGNINKSDIKQIMLEGVASVLMDQVNMFQYDKYDGLPDEVRKALNKAMIEGHCGLIDEKMAARMSQIQIARDIWISSQILKALEYQDLVIVLAGNGHIRTDMGIPFWLARVGQNEYSSIGYIESINHKENHPFNIVKLLPVADRQDPCEELKIRFRKGSTTP